MAITPVNKDMDIITKLSALPNATDGLTYQQLQEKFDEGGKALKTYINNTLIPALESVADGTSGADQIGASSISDLDGATIQAILESIRNKLKATTDSASGADFVGATVISGVAGNTVQSLIEGLKAYVDSTYDTSDEITNNRKLDETGNFTGSWFGFEKPTASDPGIQNQVDENTAKLAHIVTVNAKLTNLSTLQEMLDYINTSGGGTLYLPKGTYMVSNTLYIYANTKIVGEDKEKTVLEGDILGYLINVEGNHVTFDNLTLKGPNLSNDSGHGAISQSIAYKYLTVTNCIFDGFNTNIITQGDNRFIRVENNIFRNTPVKGTDVSSGYGIVYQSAQNTITKGNVFEDTVYRHGVYVSRSTTDGHISINHIIENNFFYGKKDGEISYPNGYELPVKIMGSQNVITRGNIFEGGIGGVFITKYDGAIVTDVDCKNIVVTDNVFTDIVASNVDNAIVHCMNRQDLTQYLIVANNTVKDCSCNFISGNNFENVTINSNMVSLLEPQTGLNAYGFRFYKPNLMKNVKIHDNFIKVGSAQRGVYYFNQTGDNAIYDRMEIYNNTFENGYFGMEFKCTVDEQYNQCKLNHNRFINTGGNGVRFGSVGALSGEIVGNVSENGKDIYINTEATGRIWCHSNDMPITTGATGLTIDKPYA